MKKIIFKISYCLRTNWKRDIFEVPGCQQRQTERGRKVHKIITSENFKCSVKEFSVLTRIFAIMADVIEDESVTVKKGEVLD